MLKGLGLRTRSQEAPGGEDHRIVRMTRVLETFYREKEKQGPLDAKGKTGESLANRERRAR